MTDADELRRSIGESWDASAAGWARQQAAWRSASTHVSAWMVDALALAPGMRVLELAAGAGETGFLAAALIGPGGTLITSDGSEPMLEIARGRAGELGLANVEFKLLDGEWIDLPLASVDAVLCRWGYMLMADPGAALRETRRVLRSGGRVALAVWDAASANQWLTIPMAVLVEHGLLEPPDAAEPGPFALGDAGLLAEMLADAGFTEIAIERLAMPIGAQDFDSWWASHLDRSERSRTAFARADESQTEAIEAQLAQRLKPFTDASGALEVPGCTLVASASA
jgi:ubiquinone/menaquinone biosynthesis C-methylase UbiE